MPTPHVNSSVLAHLLARTPRGTRAQVAREASIAPSHLSDLEAGRNRGTNPDLRARVADALDVPEAALTCYCDMPDGVCRSLAGAVA